MFIIYDFIFLIISFFYLPLYLFRRKFHKGFLARMGFSGQAFAGKRPVWVHAVSVGEALAVKGLFGELIRFFPGKKFVISTVTSSGNKIASSIARPQDLVTYLPLDFSFVVRKVIDRINPELFIIAETEIWPNLISYLHKRHIPVISVNARISDASFRGYRLVKFLFKPVLNKITLFCVQTEDDSRRLAELGVLPEKIKVTGNLKFDLRPNQQTQKNNLLREQLGLKDGKKFIVAGSTHQGEEEIILSVYKELLKRFAGLNLLIAPRHPERADEVERLITKYGFEPVRISRINPTAACHGERAVFILDTIGHLLDYYGLADLVFIGGSLVKKGGHNILEPVSLGKATLFGPYMFNFREIAGLFLKNKAAISIDDEEGLKNAIQVLLQNPPALEDLGNRARELLLKNQGATAKTLSFIKGFVS